MKDNRPGLNTPGKVSGFLYQLLLVAGGLSEEQRVLEVVEEDEDLNYLYHLRDNLQVVPTKSLEQGRYCVRGKGLVAAVAAAV